MATLTIRNVPEELHAALKERARKNRRSVNQEVIAELSVRLGDGHDFGKNQRVWQMLSLAEELRKELTTPLTAEEIRKAIDEGKR